MRKTGLIALCAVAQICLSASVANATTYYLKNVKFDDGTTATGFLSTNVSGYPDDHDILTATGTLTGYHYINDINVTYGPGDSAFTVYHNDPSYDGFLTLAVGQPLDTIAADTALLTGGASYECSTYSCPGGTARNVVSGFLTLTAPGVPEPASWALMLGGVGVIGAGLRRGRKLVTQAA